MVVALSVDLLGLGEQRLDALDEELANLTEQKSSMVAHWQGEKDAIAQIRELKEQLESLREAEIVTKSGTLLYVQALKFLETKATPAGARRARRARRVKRATRKP